jgi:hypothetical protein
MGDLVNANDARTTPYGLELAFLVGSALYVLFLVSETIHLVDQSKNNNNNNNREKRNELVQIKTSEKNISISMGSFVFLWTTTFNTSACVTCAAGLCINLSTALVWGLIPEWLEDGSHSWRALSASQVAAVTLATELPKGLFQVVFGALGDRYGRKMFLVGGLALSGLAVIIMALVGGSSGSDIYTAFCFLGVLLGLGTCCEKESFTLSLSLLSHHTSHIHQNQYTTTT